MGRMGITFLCKGIKHEGVKLSMESFLDTIWNRNLYIGIPLGAFCCSLFLLFCFFHTMRNRTIRGLRLVLTACLIWTGSVSLMRLGIFPGITFWHNFALLGLLMIPMFMYVFLFGFLEITEHDALIYIYGVLTLALVLGNARSGTILPAPELVDRADGTCVYVYHATVGTGVLTAMEIAVMIYATYLAHCKIGDNKELRKKLFPLLLGTVFILGGNMLCMLPESVFPFDMLGSVGMAICMVYIMYKQYLFDFSYRATVGAVYFLAVIVAAIPVVILSYNLEIVTGSLGQAAVQRLILCIALQSGWTVLVILFARKRLENILYQKQKHMLEGIRQFQDRAASILSRRELFATLHDILGDAIPGCEARIFEKNSNGEGYHEAVQSGHIPLSEEEVDTICDLVKQDNMPERTVIATLRYDNQICGFIYMERMRANKLNYQEVDCIRQLANIASGSLKNIDAYERVYQVSIHDELTGLYNRTYCNRCLHKEGALGDARGFLYMDMDNFKLYNDLYGEQTGDQILKWCAKKLQENAEHGKVFRVGSNEFLISVPETGSKTLVALAEMLTCAVQENGVDKPQVMQPITFSVGVAWYPGLASDAPDLFQKAKQAAFYAKQNGKNRIQVYEGNIDAERRNKETGYEQVAPTVYALVAAIDAKDSFTFQHSTNVSQYAVLLAQKLGLPGDDIHTVKVAGLLHDIGKIGIPESILKKAGKLTNEEYEIMKSHVQKSIEMIHYLPNMNYVIPAVVSHHERYDGKGYPRGLKGEGIPLLGRILAVCDSFDAMISKRAYKEALSVEYAMGELEKNKGTQFDPKAADAFIELIKEGKVPL